MKTGMNNRISNRRRAVLVGIFILAAYGVLASFLTQSRAIIMLADMVSGFSVIGIAFLMFPLFKKLNRPLSIGYLTLKYAEGMLMMAAGALFLTGSLQYMRDAIYNGVHVYVFIASGLMFYYLLYKSEFVPRFIAVWGALGILALMVSTIMALANIHYSIVDYLLSLIITNEVFLSVWLISKGFDISTDGSSRKS